MSFAPIPELLDELRAAAANDGQGSSSDVASLGSCPPITSCSSAESSTVRETGPTWSSEEARAIAP